MANDRAAALYRMVLPDRISPFGVRAEAILEETSFAIDNGTLRSRDDVEAVKAEQGVRTPQVFSGGELIGGIVESEGHLAEA